MCDLLQPNGNYIYTHFNILNSYFVYRVYLCPSYDLKYIPVTYTAGNLYPLCHAKKSLDMDMDILQMGTDTMIPWYTYRKLFGVKFPDKCEWQKGFKLVIKHGLV